MLEKIKTLITEYAEIYAKAWETLSFKHPIAATVRNDIAQDFRNLSFLDSDIYSVKASCGTGRFTAVPWIAIFDRRITDTAPKGVYVVYLLNKDTQELFLTLNQAATGTTVSELRDNAKKIRMMLRVDDDESIDTGSDVYDAGCIISKKYCIEDLNNEESFLNDLKGFLKKYQQYQEVVAFSGWWPSQEEYHPGINKEKWIELLNDQAVFTENALKMIAEFYTFGGVATCAQLAAHYQKTYNYYLMTSVHLAERVVKHTGCPVVKEEKNAQNTMWWPVLYVGKDAGKDAKGTFVWKIRNELYEALAEFGIERYLTNELKEMPEGGGKEMTIKEKVAAIKAYIAARGFNYEGDLIENFYLSLKSKPFVILAGTSGTGKTRLVKLFAEAIGAKMQLVPVRPDWSDSSDLFGHTDLSGNFQPGAIIDFIKQAEWDKSTPHFLCLDEMNLARVEYYLSDFLSIIETRDRKENGAIETDALVDVSYFQSQSAREKYGRVYIPENLYIIGTVNMDETTFPFSKKVLDRANTIEFSFVNLMARVSAGGQPVTQKLDNSFLKTDHLYLQDCDDEDLIGTVCFNLEELNQILVKANLHVGYRVRDEISFYMMNNKKAELLDFEAAFDHEIMQKILPRVQGSSSTIQKVLSELFAKCAGDYSGFAGAAAYEQMDSYLESKTCKYPNSAKKIAFMMRRYEEDGFTSYWL